MFLEVVADSLFVQINITDISSYELLGNGNTMITLKSGRKYFIKESYESFNNRLKEILKQCRGII